MAQLFKEAVGKASISILEKQAPHIIISKEALIKMSLYTKHCKEEIGWLGTAHKVNKNYYISDVFLFHQNVHSTTTEITPEGLTTFAEEILKKPEGLEIWNNTKMWGHSHVDMGVISSAQDDKQMETFADGGHNWFIRIIVNKKGDIRLDLYDYENGIIYNNLPWDAIMSEKEEQLYREIDLLEQEIEKINTSLFNNYDKEIAEEIELKVQKKTTKVTGFNNGTTTTGAGKSKRNIITNQYGTGYWENGTFHMYEKDYTASVLTIYSFNDVYDDIEEEILLQIGEYKTYIEAVNFINKKFPCNYYQDREKVIIWSAAKGLVEKKKKKR